MDEYEYKCHVRLLKKSLKRILGEALLTQEEIMTVLCDIEGMLNSRHITYIYMDGIGHELMPPHLVYGKRLSTLSHFLVLLKTNLLNILKISPYLSDV